ncbi:MAG: inositol monophosphatase [Deltaproteobacteria bacterium]|nr:inositol monophosphatase [Deltaproteobacteria bacterium]
MSEYLDFALSIAREAGDVLMEYFHKEHTIDYKGRIDIVTDVDHRSEEVLISRITDAYPDHDIVTEESAGKRRGSRARWILDPIDGTTNYAHGFPFFCVSVALALEGEIRVAVINAPQLREEFSGEKGNGAFLNGTKIAVSMTETLAKSFLATGFPYDIAQDSYNNINYFSGMAMQSLAIRRAGSAALDLAYVAAGRFDGFWELKLNPWDTAAGWLLVEEAGGVVTRISGDDYFLESPTILASNGRIHLAMIDALGAIDPFDSRFDTGQTPSRYNR